MPATQHHAAELIAQTFIGFLGRAPEYEALNYYTARFDALMAQLGEGVSLDDGLKALAREIYHAAQQIDEVPDESTYSAAEYVSDIYDTVLGRPASDDADGWAYWVKALEAGELQREDLLAVMLASAREAERDGQYLANRTQVALEFAREENSGPDVFDQLQINAAQVLQGVDHTPESVTAAIERLEANQPPADPSEPDAPGNPTPDAPGGSDGGNGGGNGGGGQQPDLNPPTEPGVPEITLGAALSLAQLPAHGYRIDPDQPFVQSMQSVNSVWHTREQVESILAGASNADELELDSLYQWGILGSTLDLLEAARRDDVRVVLEQAEHIYVTEMSIRWPAYQALLEFDGFQLGATEIAYDQVNYYYMGQPWTDGSGPYELFDYRYMDVFSVDNGQQRLDYAKALFDGARNSDELNFEATFGWTLEDSAAKLLTLLQEDPDSSLLRDADEVRVAGDRVLQSDWDVLSSQLDNFVTQEWQQVIPELAKGDEWVPVVVEGWYPPHVEWAIEVEAGKSYAVMLPNLPIEDGNWRDSVPWISFRDSVSGENVGSGSLRMDTEGVPYVEITAEETGHLIAEMSLYSGDENRLEDFRIVMRDAEEIQPATPPQPGPEAEIRLNLEDDEYVGSATLDNLFIAPIVADQMSLRDGVSIDGVDGENILLADLLPVSDLNELARPELQNINIVRLIAIDQHNLSVVNYGLNLGGSSGIEEVRLDSNAWRFLGDSIVLQDFGNISSLVIEDIESYPESVPTVRVEGIAGDHFDLMFLSGYSQHVDVELFAAEGIATGTLLVENGRNIQFTEAESNMGRQAAVLELNRTSDIGHGIVSLGNYPHQFSKGFNLEKVMIHATSDLTLGVVHLGSGQSTIDGVNDRAFQLLDASSSVGNLTIDAMLERDEGGTEVQSTQWDIMLGSGDDRFVVLNSRVNGIAAPSNESVLSGGEGDDTLVLRAEVYESWVSSLVGLEGVIEGFETLEIDGPILDGMSFSATIGGNHIKNLIISDASASSLSVVISGMSLVDVKHSRGSHVHLDGGEGTESDVGALIGEATISYYDFDSYYNNPEYYFQDFTSISTVLSLIQLAADEGYSWDGQGYIVSDSDELRSILLKSIVEEGAGESRVALILDETQVETIESQDVGTALLNLSGNLNGVNVTLPEQFVVVGSDYSDTFSLSENDINASEIHWSSMPADDPIPARIIRGFDTTDELRLDIEGGVGNISELSVTFPQGGNSTDAMIEALALLSANEAGWYEFEGDTYVIGKGDAYSQAEYQGEYHYRDLLFVKLEDFVGLGESQVLPA